MALTYSSSETNNQAIRGNRERAQSHRRPTYTSAIGHPSVRTSIHGLEQRGWEATQLPVYDDGVVRVEDVRAALRPDTILISIMMANNEIGTVQPIAEIGALVRGERKGGRRHLWFHTDAVQAAGRVPIDVESLGCDLLSLSAHKIYAPKGCGALFVRKGVRLTPQQVGGHQERERRGGTEADANIGAIGAATELAQREMPERNEHTRRLRDRFEEQIAESAGEIVFNGSREQRLP